MEHNDDELRLAPIAEDELGFAPIEDDDINKTIAPDIPYNAGVRLIPVICSACKTRLYAGENQVGLWKRCPDCYRLTEILAVPERFMLTADDPEAAGGYNIQEPDVSRQDIFQIRAENQRLFKEDQEKQNRIRHENRLPPPVFIDKPPMMENALNRLLKSGKEKKDEESVIQQQREIEEETEAIKQAVRSGTLDAYLAGSQNNSGANDPAVRKRLEKQRQFDAATSSPTPPSMPLPPPLPPSTSSPSSSPSTLPPPLPSPLTIFPSPSQSEIPLLSKPSKISLPSERSQHAASDFLWSPLFDSHCRARMVVLTLCGFLGNLTGEKARSMIWQILFDRVYGQTSGYSYNLIESGFFLVNFWFGAVLSIVWLTMLFLFGISLFLETSAGKDRVENWIPFDLDFGCSYIGWSLLILFVSGFPGFIVWQGTSFFMPDQESALIILHFIGQFLCFPILFLCVIESDTFYGNYPRKTLTSLYQHPGLWLKLYGKAIVLIGIPTAILAGLLLAGTALEKHWFMQSLFYYLIAAVLLTFCGYFVLFYFRLLGKTAWAIRLKE
ncbi:MAG: hypothetical protein LBF88_03455 [Planctomycetaceae bacterium]|jgi:hypothetical protein|nr:hypothetical protein [Planctomycetaceae bacterium]